MELCENACVELCENACMEDLKTRVWSILKTRVVVCLCVRTWDNHVKQATDTDDTDSEADTGGDGYWSHGSTNLSHQHWVQQFVVAGSCKLHDTEDAEAAHKTSMGLAASRVRHYQANKTQANMQNYLLHHAVFEALRKRIVLNRPRRCVTYKMGIQLPLLECIRGLGPAQPVRMGGDLHTVTSQKRFLHPEARVARVELMDLVCDLLGLSRSRRSYAALSRLSWSFGQVRFTLANVCLCTFENACDGLLKPRVSDILKTCVCVF